MNAGFRPGDRVHVALLDPFVGTVTGPVPGREFEDIYEIAAPIEWCIRNRESRLQNVFGRNLRKLVPETVR